MARIDPLTGQGLGPAEQNQFKRWLTNLHRSLFLGFGDRSFAAFYAFAQPVPCVAEAKGWPALCLAQDVALAAHDGAGPDLKAVAKAQGLSVLIVRRDGAGQIYPEGIGPLFAPDSLTPFTTDPTPPKADARV